MLRSSLILSCADAHRVEAGGALAVDRHGFARLVTEKVRSHPNITVIPGEVTEIPMAALESSDTSTQNLQALTVSPDGGSYWTIIDTYTFPAYDDTAVYDESAVTDEFANGVGTIDATAEAETTEETPTEEAVAEEEPTEDAAGDEAPAEENGEQQENVK